MNLKILCFNIHKGIGWRRNSTILKLSNKINDYQADIIFLQEIRGIHFEFLTSRFSKYFFAYGQNAVYQHGNHGNAIFSKYPIIFCKNIDISMHRFEKRGLFHCILKISDDQQILHLLCVHLGLREVDRFRQLNIIVQYIKANISNQERIILAGDFNDWRQYATDPLVNYLKFEEAFLNNRNNYAKTYPAWIPMLKLDRIYYRGLKCLEAHRLIDKSWRYLSDHIGLSVFLKIGSKDGIK